MGLSLLENRGGKGLLRCSVLLLLAHPRGCCSLSSAGKSCPAQGTAAASFYPSAFLHSARCCNYPGKLAGSGIIKAEGLLNFQN